MLITVTDDFSGDFLGGPMVPKDLRITNPYGGPVTINKHVWIGIGTVILPDCIIGEGAAVGTMSVVNKDLDPWIIYLGYPVRAVKRRRKVVLDLEKKLSSIEKDDNLI